MRALGRHVTCRAHERPATEAGAALRQEPSHCESSRIIRRGLTNCRGFGQDPAEIIKPNTLGQSQTQSERLIGRGDLHPRYSSPPLSAAHTGEQHPQAGPTRPPGLREHFTRRSRARESTGSTPLSLLGRAGGSNAMPAVSETV